MIWSDITTALGDLLVVQIITPTSEAPSNNTDFNNILPRITEAAEQRIYRELDFLANRTTDASVSLSTTSRLATLASEIIVLQSANVITPQNTLPIAGKRNALTLISKDVLDQIWPQELVGKTVPQYLAQLNATTLIVAPTADQTYTLEVTGIMRPAPISATNISTYLSLTYPDLFLYACMVFGAGYQRDFSAMSDDPKLAMSWENMYQLAKTSTMDEEQRRKSQGTNWSTYSATPQSAPRK